MLRFYISAGLEELSVPLHASSGERGARPVPAADWCHVEAFSSYIVIHGGQLDLVEGEYLHGEAGNRLARTRGPLGFLASELLGEIPSIMAGYSGDEVVRR